MALSKVNFNSLNLTPTASKTVVFNSNNNGIEAGDVGGSLVLISEQTASSSATVSFTSGIDSTYKEYIFKFINIHPASTAYFQFNLSSDVVLDSTYPIYVFKFINMHPATDDQSFSFQGSTNTGSSYGVTITSSSFRTYNQENDGGNGFGYLTDYDLAQSTNFQRLGQTVGNANDESFSGELFLFNPSSTTFVKHFIARNVHAGYADYVGDGFTAGYFNTTSAIDAMQFKFASGNTDSGTIKLYGIKDS